MYGKHKVWLSAVCLVALAAGAVGYTHWRSPGANAGAGGARLSWQPYRAGERLRYQLSLDTHVDAQGGRMLQYSLTGQWTVDVVSSDATETRLLVSVVGPTLASEMAAADQQGRIKEAQGDFEQPLLVTLDPKGRVTGVREQAPIEMQASSMLRSIAAVMQLVAPDDEQAKVWSSSEQDSVGTYDASYQRSGSHIVKSKLRYSSLAQKDALGGGSATQMQLLQARGTFELGDHGLVKELSFDETTKVTAGMMNGLTAQTQYRLRYQGSGPIPAQSPARHVTQLVEQATVAPFERTKSTNGYSVETDRARIAGRNFPTLLSELDALPVSDKDDTDEMGHQRRKAFIGMAALMRLKTEAVNDALREIKQGNPRARILWDALASAGTPAAQSALLEVIQMPRWGTGERNSQMIGLSMAASPTAATVDFLKSMTGDPVQGQQARYGLGTAVHSLMDDDPARASKLVSELTAATRAATTANERLDMLSALGNTAHPDARATLDTFLTSQDATERGRAVWALRQQSGGDIDTVLATMMVNDPSASVRANAVQAAASRNASPALLAGVMTVLNQEADASAKNAALFALRRFEGMDPAIAQQLAQASHP